MLDSLRILLPFIFNLWNEFTTPLRHVMAINHLRLLWAFRNHVDYSDPSHSRAPRRVHLGYHRLPLLLGVEAIG